jgi:hypothetical protein
MMRAFGFFVLRSNAAYDVGRTLVRSPVDRSGSGPGHWLGLRLRDSGRRLFGRIPVLPIGRFFALSAKVQHLLSFRGFGFGGPLPGARGGDRRGRHVARTNFQDAERVQIFLMRFRGFHETDRAFGMAFLHAGRRQECRRSQQTQREEIKQRLSERIR